MGGGKCPNDKKICHHPLWTHGVIKSPHGIPQRALWVQRQVTFSGHSEDSPQRNVVSLSWTNRIVGFKTRKLQFYAVWVFYTLEKMRAKGRFLVEADLFGIPNIKGGPSFHECVPNIVLFLRPNLYRILEVSLGIHHVKDWFPLQPDKVDLQYMVKNDCVWWEGGSESKLFFPTGFNSRIPSRFPLSCSANPPLSSGFTFLTTENIRSDDGWIKWRCSRVSSAFM